MFHLAGTGSSGGGIHRGGSEERVSPTRGGGGGRMPSPSPQAHPSSALVSVELLSGEGQYNQQPLSSGGSRAPTGHHRQLPYEGEDPPTIANVPPSQRQAPLPRDPAGKGGPQSLHHRVLPIPPTTATTNVARSSGADVAKLGPMKVSTPRSRVSNLAKRSVSRSASVRSSSSRSQSAAASTATAADSTTELTHGMTPRAQLHFEKIAARGHTRRENERFCCINHPTLDGVLWANQPVTGDRGSPSPMASVQELIAEKAEALMGDESEARGTMREEEHLARACGPLDDLRRLIEMTRQTESVDSLTQLVEDRLLGPFDLNTAPDSNLISRCARIAECCTHVTESYSQLQEDVERSRETIASMKQSAKDQQDQFQAASADIHKETVELRGKVKKMETQMETTTEETAYWQDEVSRLLEETRSYQSVVNILNDFNTSADASSSPSDAAVAGATAPGSLNSQIFLTAENSPMFVFGLVEASARSRLEAMYFAFFSDLIFDYKRASMEEYEEVWRIADEQENGLSSALVELEEVKSQRRNLMREVAAEKEHNEDLTSTIERYTEENAQLAQELQSVKRRHQTELAEVKQHLSSTNADSEQVRLLQSQLAAVRKELDVVKTEHEAGRNRQLVSRGTQYETASTMGRMQFSLPIRKVPLFGLFAVNFPFLRNNTNKDGSARSLRKLRGSISIDAFQGFVHEYNALGELKMSHETESLMSVERDANNESLLYLQFKESNLEMVLDCPFVREKAYEIFSVIHAACRCYCPELTLPSGGDRFETLLDARQEERREIRHDILFDGKNEFCVKADSNTSLEEPIMVEGLLPAGTSEEISDDVRLQVVWGAEQLHGLAGFASRGGSDAIGQDQQQQLGGKTSSTGDLAKTVVHHSFTDQPTAAGCAPSIDDRPPSSPTSPAVGSSASTTTGTAGMEEHPFDVLVVGLPTNEADDVAAKYTILDFLGTDFALLTGTSSDDPSIYFGVFGRSRLFPAIGGLNSTLYPKEGGFVLSFSVFETNFCVVGMYKPSVSGLEGVLSSHRHGVFDCDLSTSFGHVLVVGSLPPEQQLRGSGLLHQFHPVISGGAPPLLGVDKTNNSVNSTTTLNRSASWRLGDGKGGVTPSCLLYNCSRKNGLSPVLAVIESKKNALVTCFSVAVQRPWPTVFSQRGAAPGLCFRIISVSLSIFDPSSLEISSTISDIDDQMNAITTSSSRASVPDDVNGEGAFILELSSAQIAATTIELRQEAPPAPQLPSPSLAEDGSTSASIAAQQRHSQQQASSRVFGEGGQVLSRGHMGSSFFGSYDGATELYWEEEEEDTGTSTSSSAPGNMASHNDGDDSSKKGLGGATQQQQQHHHLHALTALREQLSRFSLMAKLRHPSGRSLTSGAAGNLRDRTVLGSMRFELEALRYAALGAEHMLSATVTCTSRLIGNATIRLTLTQ